jgi:predicted O-methyltransferase YrrM
MHNLHYAGYNALDLYAKYDSELANLNKKLRPHFYAMQSRRETTAFGEIEGEMLYMLIRESKPEIVFEVSPDCGWSTNYIMAALTKNGQGNLHTFELMATKRGRPTVDVIRGNQLKDWDLNRLHIHLGDALETTPMIGSDQPIDFLLIDSNHDDWFAKWYIENLIPRVKGIVFVQDIAFVDRLEPSTEAETFWKWAKEQRINLNLIGFAECYEAIKQQRKAYNRLWSNRSNALVFRNPNVIEADLPSFLPSPESALDAAQAAFEVNSTHLADKHLTNAVNQLLGNDRDPVRHRQFIRAAKIYDQLGEQAEATRLLQNALGISAGYDAIHRLKTLSDVCIGGMSTGRWGIAIQAGLLVTLAHPTGFPTLIGKIVERLRGKWFSE